MITAPRWLPHLDDYRTKMTTAPRWLPHRYDYHTKVTTAPRWPPHPEVTTAPRWLPHLDDYRTDRKLACGSWLPNPGVIANDRVSTASMSTNQMTTARDDYRTRWLPHRAVVISCGSHLGTDRKLACGSHERVTSTVTVRLSVSLNNVQSLSSDLPNLSKRAECTDLGYSYNLNMWNVTQHVITPFKTWK